jgi:hypothetical protein
MKRLIGNMPSLAIIILIVVITVPTNPHPVLTKLTAMLSGKPVRPN